MSIIDKMLSEAAVAENSNAASEVSTEDNANVDCSTFEKTQSQVFGNSFSVVFMGIYAKEKDMQSLRFAPNDAPDDGNALTKQYR